MNVGLVHVQARTNIFLTVRIASRAPGYLIFHSAGLVELPPIHLGILARIWFVSSLTLVSPSSVPPFSRCLAPHP